jgi:hypothetical protein
MIHRLVYVRTADRFRNERIRNARPGLWALCDSYRACALALHCVRLRRNLGLRNDFRTTPNLIYLRLRRYSEQACDSTASLGTAYNADLTLTMRGAATRRC